MSKQDVEIKIEEKDSNGEPLLCGLTHEGTDFIEGKPYTSVGFSASRYGMGSPCLNEQEINQAVAHAKEWILEEGDIPIIKDLRQKATLLAFMKVK